MNVLQLDNGLKCILERREGSGVVAMQAWVRVGSADEGDDIAGMSHFIEHLIFKGTDAGDGYEASPQDRGSRREYKRLHLLRCDLLPHRHAETLL